MHFLQKITMRAAMDQNVCVIFFMTVSIFLLWQRLLPVVPPPGAESYDITPGNRNDLKSVPNLR